jgi:hypothetical protein
VRHPERWQALRDHPGPRLMLLWHETLLPLLLTHRHQGVTILVSRARDGRYLRDLARSLGFDTIEGSSHRGRVGAMREALRGFEAGALIGVTPDGPRGPRRVIKPGSLQAIQQAGGVVGTAFADARPARRLASWDRFLVPLPGANVRIAFGEPFRIAPGPGGVVAAAERATADLAGLEQEVAWHAAPRTD